MSLNPIVFVNRIDFVNRPIEDWPMELARLRGKPDLIPPNQLEIDWHSFRMKSNCIFTKKKDGIRCNVWLKIFPLGGAKISAWPCKFKARTSSRGFSLEPNESIISHTFPIRIDHSSFFALFFTNFHFHREGPELVDTRDCILFF